MIEPSSPIKTVQYCVNSHIQEDAVKMMSNSTGNVIRRKIPHQQFPDFFNILTT